MADSEQIMRVLDDRVRRRDERRDFFKAALGAAAVGAGAFAFANQATAQSTNIDNDVLNFALNLEYLEAQFYAYAANGRGIDASLQTGGSAAPSSTQGSVQLTAGAAGQPRKVTFADPLIAEYAQEIAADEERHVAFLRGALTTAAVAQPALNISGGPTGAFTAAARAAGVIGSSASFDPYADDDSFLLAAFIFEDVGVTAYKGASPLITNKTFLQAAAGILAAEAYHSAIVRTTLYARGISTASSTTGLFANVQKISDARDFLDGTGSDKDQGIAPTNQTVNTASGSTSVSVSNIVPTDSNAIAYSRSPNEVLHIVYLTQAAVSMGGFFPAGLNGNIRAATAVS